MATISIFVSSTFSDFHHERDLIQRSVRPALDELVLEYGCRVEIVDLRWGIDTSNVRIATNRDRKVFDVCLAEVDRCRPLFVGLLGDRYGWVPPARRVRRVADRAGLDASDLVGASVTEIEFHYGGLQEPTQEALFLLRTVEGSPPADWQDANTTALDRLRRRIETSGAETCAYRLTADSNGAVAAPDFESLLLDRLAPRVVARGRLAAAARADDEGGDPLFWDDRRTGFAGREAELSAVLEALRSRARGVVIVGPSGVGKSSLLVAAIDRLVADGARVVVHRVTPWSASEAQLVASIARELGIGIPAGVTGRDALRALVDGARAMGQIVVAIDGIDGLELGELRDRLRPLTQMPGNVRLACTTTDDRQRAVLERAGLERVDVGLLAGRGLRRAVDALASSVRRELPDETAEVLAARPRTGLWLQLAVQQMIGIDEDEFERMDESLPPHLAVSQLLTSFAADLPNDLGALVAQGFEAAKTRCGRAPVKTMLSALAVAPAGIDQADLAELAGVSTLDVALFRQALGRALIDSGRSGRVGFGHDLVRQVADTRYVLDRQDVHRALADHYVAAVARDDDVRDEALWHALHSARLVPAGRLIEAAAEFAPAARRAADLLTTAIVADRQYGAIDLPGLFASLSPPTLPVINHILADAPTRRLTTDEYVQLFDLAAAVPEAGSPASGSKPAPSGRADLLEHGGRILIAAGRRRAASDVLGDALAIRRAAAKADPDNADRAAELAASLVALTRATHLPTVDEHVIAAATVVVDACRRARVLAGPKPAVLDTLASGLLFLGQCRSALRGRPRLDPIDVVAARDALDEALELRRDLVAQHDDLRQQLRLAELLLAVGEFRWDNFRSQAQQAFLEGADICRALQLADPTTMEVASLLARLLRFVAASYTTDFHTHEQARSCYQEAAGIARDLGELDPGHDVQQAELIEMLAEVGRMLIRYRRPDHWERDLRDAIDTYTGLVTYIESLPATTPAARNFARWLHKELVEAATKVGKDLDGHQARQEAGLLVRTYFRFVERIDPQKIAAERQVFLDLAKRMESLVPARS